MTEDLPDFDVIAIGGDFRHLTKIQASEVQDMLQTRCEWLVENGYKPLQTLADGRLWIWKRDEDESA